MFNNCGIILLKNSSHDVENYRIVLKHYISFLKISNCIEFLTILFSKNSLKAKFLHELFLT